MSSLVRRATVTDIAELLRLRGVMFNDMSADSENESWTHSSRSLLERNLPTEAIIGAVIDRTMEPGLCGAGLLQIEESLGSPRFPRGVKGHISSVAVDVSWRRRGLGERIVHFLVDEARSLGLERVELHATDDGERIYRNLGFRDRSGGVELRLEL